MSAKAGAPAGAESPPQLASFEFVALCAISVLAFSNLAIFYGFYDYLGGIGIAPQWRGPLLALEPLTALVARPFLGHLLTLANGVRFMRVGLVLATASLLCYPAVQALWGIALVRVMHGAGFVTLVSGVMGCLAGLMPRERSAQGFGLVSATVLLPYALMPPFVEFLLPHLAAPGLVYAMAAPLMLPAFLLLGPLSRRTRARAAELHPTEAARPSVAEALRGLADPAVASLALANLLLVAGHSVVFFFMRGFALGAGLDNPGAFFTCANAVIILLRVAGGRLLDRMDKGRGLLVSFVGLGALVPLFSLAGGPGALLLMAALYGLGMSFTMPLTNSMMLLLSPQKLRAFNNNLLLVGLDAGFFAGPLLGGLLLANGWSHAGLFGAGGAAFVLGALCVLPAARRLRAMQSRHEG